MKPLKTLVFVVVSASRQTAHIAQELTGKAYHDTSKGVSKIQRVIRFSKIEGQKVG